MRPGSPPWRRACASAAKSALWLAALTGLWGGPARAQERWVVLVPGADLAQTEQWRARVERELGVSASSDPNAWAARGDGIAPERLALLSRIEALLVRARAETAALAEADALGTLAEASRLAEPIGDLPGASAWAAEIELAIGVTAAQAGRAQLAEQAFRRAATLDRERRLLEGEAAPDTVALYARVQREVALSAAGEFQVRASVERARVYLDDVPLGVAPVAVRATVGRHLLRVEADGHRTYGAFIDVLAGQRAALRVELAPAPSRDGARELARAAQAYDYAGVVAAARALADAGGGRGGAIVVERAGDGRRALLVRCTAQGCAEPVRAAPGVALAAAAGALRSDELARGRAWLSRADAAVKEPAASPWWERWYVWGGVAVAAALAAGVAIAADGEPPPSRLRVVVEAEAP